MKLVTITIDGHTQHLTEITDGTWEVIKNAPLTAGEYPIELTLIREDGSTVVINSDDPDFANILKLIVTESGTVSGKRMLDYYPEIIKAITEFQGLMWTEGCEFDIIYQDFDLAYNDAFFDTMSADRVSEWEKALGITSSSNDTLQQRRDVITAKFRGSNKLNTSSINSIVNAFTGGTAISHFKDNVLTVEIKPPSHNKDYKFVSVEDELKKRIPAHIGLNVLRDYATWKELKDNFPSWNTVSEAEDWTSIKMFVAPQ